jgi:PAS domain S-box-containing protein
MVAECTLRFLLIKSIVNESGSSLPVNGEGGISMNTQQTDRPNLMDQLERIHSHDHVCMISNSYEEELTVLEAFVRIGLRRGERCLCLIDTDNPALLFDEWRRNKIDVDQILNSKDFIIRSYQETCVRNGDFKMDRMMDFLSDAVSDALSLGYVALRMVGILFTRQFDQKKMDHLLLVKHESCLHDFFSVNQCLAICLYRRNYFTPHILHDAIRMHPLVLYRNRLCHNFYHIPPHDLLKPDSIAHEIDSMLTRLYDHACADEALQRQRNEESLRISDARYRDLVEHISDMIWRIDPQGTILYVNPMVEKTFGYKSSELVGRHIQSLLTLESYETAMKGLQQRMRGELGREGILLELTFKISQDRTMIGECRTTPIFDPHGELQEIEGITRDITARKQAEENLRESQRNYSALLSNIPGMAYRCRNDREWTMEFISEGCLQLTGYSVNQLIENREIAFASLICEEDRDRVWSTVQCAVQKNEPYELIYRIVTAHGREKWVWEKGRGIRDADASLLFLEGFINDITDFKRADAEREAFHRLSQRLISVLNVNEICRIVAEESLRLFRHDAFWICLYDASNSKILAGYSEDTFKGMEAPQEVILDWINEFSVMKEPRLINRSEAPQQSEFIPFGEKSRLSRSLMFVPIRWENHVIGDLSVQSYFPNKYKEKDLELLQTFAEQCGSAFYRVQMEENQAWLEEQFLHSQKMEAIGQLAGGVAHDFNNLLTGIIGNLNLAELRAPAEIRRFLGNAKDAADRAAKLIQQLLSFSRKSIVELKPLNLNQVVNEVSRLARQLIDRRIAIEIHTQSELPLVLADASRINSVLMNMCVNARDAIDEILNGQTIPERKGDQFIITLETKSIHTDSIRGDAHGSVQSRDLVVLSVIDNGTGMDAEVQNHIFEPFFSTKEVGKGTGLGLASVYGIVKQHNGWIDTNSEIGVGTAFHIYFPAIKSEMVTCEAIEQTDVLLGGKETILFVDDEEMIRTLGRSILEQYGYTVVLAADGEMALELFQRERDTIDLIILDLSMPQMSGREALQKIRELDPTIKVIVSTGYTDGKQIEPLIKLGITNFITKPYRPVDLACKVRRILDASGIVDDSS